MSQNSLVDTSTAQSSKTSGLKPALAAALASLEVQLDQELARYRRTRTVYRTLTQLHVGSSTSNQLQQLTVISTKEGKKPTSEESRRSNQNNFSAVTTNTPAPIQPEELSVADKTNTPSVFPTETEEEIPVTPKTEELHNLKMPSVRAKTTSTSIVPTIAEDRKSENPKEPDDFLESSEALLQSLKEEPNTQRRTNPSDMLSPLGIGSMLLLLLASLTLGFIVFNPTRLPYFSLDGWLKPKTLTNAENTDESGKNTKTGLQQPQLTFIPKYPNLAESEFPEVRNPNDVVGLKPKAFPLLKASPHPAATQKPTNPATTAIQLQPVASPRKSPPISTAITPNLSSHLPNQNQKHADAQLKTSRDGYYHLVIENQGDRTFASAKNVVPDAYLSTDGKLIYLAAAKNKDKAQQLLQKLQAQGIKARIQQP